MGRHSIGPWALCRAYLLINILLPSIQVNKGLLSAHAEAVDNFSLDPTNETDNPSDETASVITTMLANAPSDQSSAPPEDGPWVYKKGLQDSVYHNVSGFAIENVEICKSRPFALTQENYILSGADEWLRDYTMENQNRRYMQQHGIISTIAYDFLGDMNFKCAIGFQHLCNVQCLTVVAHVEDLRLARQVYFVLASSSHFISALTVVHEALVAAQSTTGLLSGRMAMTFYFTELSADEEMRARAYQLLIEGTLMAAEVAVSSIIPMLPWSKLSQFISEKIQGLQKTKAHIGEGDAPSIYAPFEVSRYYGNRDDSTQYSGANAMRVTKIFRDKNMREFFMEERIYPEDILHYIDDSKPVTGAHVWQVVQHLAETSHDRMPSEYQTDNPEPKKRKKFGLPLPGAFSETMKEYKKWERQKKNQLFDEMMAVEPLRIGIPDHYRFKKGHPNGDEAWANLGSDDNGVHSRIFGPGDNVIGKEAASLKVAKHSPPGALTSAIWGDTARVAWGYFKNLGISSWRTAGDALDWLDSDMPPPYKIGVVGSTGFDDNQVDRLLAGIRDIIKEDPDRAVGGGDHQHNLADRPGAPSIPIRRLSYEEYLREKDAQRREAEAKEEKKRKKGKKEKKEKKEKKSKGKGRMGEQNDQDGGNQEEQTNQDSGPRIISLGPAEKIPYYRDRGTAFNDFKMDITALLHPVLEGDFESQKKRKRRLSWQEKVMRTEQTLSGFYPSWKTGVVDTTVKMMFSSWQAEDPSKEHNEMSLQYVIQKGSALARKGLKETANRIFGPPGVESNGDSEIADLMAAGSLLPVNGGSMSTWTSAEVEKLITKTVMSRAINAALRSQKVYISCTQDFLHFKTANSKGIEVQDCELDNSGPQHLKACIGKAVCYIYRWNDRPLIMGHHNEEPFGLDQVAGPPWDIDVQDIIISSFLSKINGNENAQLSDGKADFINSGPNANTALNPSAAGVFTVPVCLAPKNWNTQTENYWIGNDINPYAPVKALPCYCGNLGEDTSQIWYDTGLMHSKAQYTYTHKNCPNQFKKRLPDWLERYVAMCNMNIHKAKSGGKIKSGKHRFCDLVHDELKNTGVQTVTELDKEVRYALKCKIKRKKKSKGCKKYYRTPISSVWAETQEVNLKRAEEELQQKGPPAVPVVDGFTPEELREWERELMEIEGMKGEFKEMDRIQREFSIDMRTLPSNVPASIIESRLRDFEDREDEDDEDDEDQDWGQDEDEDEDQDEDQDNDQDKGFGNGKADWDEDEKWSGAPGTWGDDGFFRYSSGHFA